MEALHHRLTGRLQERAVVGDRPLVLADPDCDVEDERADRVDPEAPHPEEEAAHDGAASLPRCTLAVAQDLDHAGHRGARDVVHGAASALDAVDEPLPDPLAALRRRARGAAEPEHLVEGDDVRVGVLDRRLVEVVVARHHAVREALRDVAAELLELLRGLLDELVDARAQRLVLVEHRAGSLARRGQLLEAALDLLEGKLGDLRLEQLVQLPAQRAELDALLQVDALQLLVQRLDLVVDPGDAEVLRVAAGDEQVELLELELVDLLLQVCCLIGERLRSLELGVAERLQLVVERLHRLPLLLERVVQRGECCLEGVGLGSSQLVRPGEIAEHLAENVDSSAPLRSGELGHGASGIGGSRRRIGQAASCGSGRLASVDEQAVELIERKIKLGIGERGVGVLDCVAQSLLLLLGRTGSAADEVVELWDVIVVELVEEVEASLCASLCGSELHIVEQLSSELNLSSGCAILQHAEG